MHSLKKISLGLMLAAIVPMANCFSAAPTDALETNRAKWKKAGVKHYRYTFQIGCFCTPEFTMPRTIEVRDGKLRSSARADGKAEKPEMKRYFGEMESVFKIIDKANADKAEKLTVKYDSKLGFPTRISIDHKSNVADDEVTYTVTKFEVIRRR